MSIFNVSFFVNHNGQVKRYFCLTLSICRNTTATIFIGLRNRCAEFKQNYVLKNIWTQKFFCRKL